MSITAQFLKFALVGAEWVMYLLIACSILSIAIIIERILYFRKNSGDFGSFVKELTERFHSNESSEKISSWCTGQKPLFASVAAIGLDQEKNSIRAVEESMNATMIAARSKMDRGLIVLATLGNNTPFIGLFGTIIGIIQAFNALATSKSAGPEVVMASISEALVATAVGLMVAIPAVIAFNILGRTIKTRMSQSDTVAKLVLTHCSRNKSIQPI